MSKQMSREEAVEYLRQEIINAHRFSNDHQTFHESNQAISILAPEPRTEPPGVEEVGDEEMCWYWEKTCWYVTVGCDVREGMIGGEYWLPLSALPMPKGGA